MEITAKMVKALRDRTGAGMMDCKKSLVECNGDEELAIELLRKKGADMADKKSARTASDGLVVCSKKADGSAGAVVEVNCETDFVGRGDVFRGFAVPLGELALSSDDESINVETFSTQPFPGGGGSVEEVRRELITKVGENVTVRRIQVLKASDGNAIATYDHRGKIGVLIEISKDAVALGKDLAMHVAAMNPSWVSADEVPQAAQEKERDIYLEQAKSTGKPDAIIERIVEGRLKKFREENTLLGQVFVKDNTKSVGDIVKQNNASVSRFVRMELAGE